jgi:hypothetical protein
MDEQKIRVVFNSLKAIRYHGEPVKIKKGKGEEGAAAEDFVKKFDLALKRSFDLDDESVVEEVRRVVAHPDTMLFLVTDGLRYHVYTSEKSESRATPSTKKARGCFIATAACGDPFGPEVIALSAFRDDVLLGSSLGRGFVQLYYAVSPAVASLISRSVVLQRAVMSLMIRPAVCVVTAFRSKEEE